jgi:hypothetical protein
MELKYLLLLMALLYVLPELFRRRPKKYEYPQIPEPTPRKAPAETIQAAPSVSISKQPVSAPVLFMPPEVHIPSNEEEISPWQGQLSPAMIQTGYIFAEVLQPPRAYRPITPRRFSPHMPKVKE